MRLSFSSLLSTEKRDSRSVQYSFNARSAASTWESSENREMAAGIRGEVSDIAWGNQIRSYVLQPYTMVKDLRTGAESSNAQAVLDGALDSFMNSYLKWLSLGCPARNTMTSDE